MPRISVIIPTFNASAFLESAIASVASQSYRDFEVIIVDDGSSDETIALAETLLKKYSLSGTVFPKPAHIRKGAGGARNAGAKIARGEILAFLDSDDSWTAEHLNRANRALTQKDHKVVAYCARGLGIHQRTGRCHDIPRDGFPMHGLCDMRSTLLGGMIIPNQTLCVQTGAFHSVGGYHEHLSCYEDWWLVLNLSLTGAFFVDDHVGCNVLIREASLSNQTTPDGRPYMSSAMFRDALRFVRFAKEAMQLNRDEVFQLSETITNFVAGQLFASLRARLWTETQMIFGSILKESCSVPLLCGRVLIRTTGLSLKLVLSKWN